MTSTSRATDASELLADDELLLAWRAGDHAALGRVYVTYSEAVRGFLARIYGGRMDDIDDVLQQVFLTAHNSIAQFRGDARLRTWLFGIAVRVAARYRRSRARRTQASEKWTELAPTWAAPPDNNARQQLLALANALVDLDDDLRIAFVMCAIEQVPGREAAAVLGIREGTLAKRVHTAREHLRSELGRTAP